MWREKQSEDRRQLRINVSFFSAAVAVEIVLVFYQTNTLWTSVLLVALEAFSLVPLCHVCSFHLRSLFLTTKERNRFMERIGSAPQQ